GEAAGGEERPVGDSAQGPVFGGLTDKARQQAEVFANRLGRMARHRRRWPARRQITCYRLYDRDIPEVPLAVDLYEHALHIAEYDRPHEHDLAQHADWLDLMVRTAAETVGVPVADVFLKRRLRQRGAAQYQRLGEQGRIIQAHEGGLVFEVNLSDYLDTGLFLDHRVTRSMVREEAAGKRFLNLFAYTGAFTVYAAAGQAASTTTVDRSEAYLDWARRNMAANGFTGPAHRFLQAEAMRFLSEHRPGPRYDLAVVDPPTFSNRKGEPDYWDVQRDHAGLLTALRALMPPGGVIYFATNFRRFKLAEPELGWAEIQEITDRTVPEDFARKRPHLCWRMVITP
ncbi:MAG TPA: class I SAM-dependent methyltransferase, partial [Phycisphaerae bacterium]|nr:class I SAM-dependent methyltransferase [Phycisphaerae bacterium]